MADPVRTSVELPELTAQQQQQLKSLSNELRCLVCQNQTLAESNAELAGDLRRVVHLQVASGKSDADIKAYLVQRYGDFVLYKPPVKNTTALLWGGPFALLAIGAASWFVIGRRQTRQVEKSQSPASPQNAVASEQARQTAADLLRKH